ncbi:hypothetical protein G5I_09826 [Acromyrmex echinatior]|uniref:Uncharacterized protein n=1 Tax=Acromyrmex echinatior TaxID=103372 RepID=F4WV35_ACREC|nr:hypothetical protein G5I_09826 [Acromyrmex echinatior]
MAGARKKKKKEKLIVASFEINLYARGLVHAIVNIPATTCSWQRGRYVQDYSRAQGEIHDLPLTIYLDPLNPFILLWSSFDEEAYRHHWHPPRNYDLDYLSKRGIVKRRSDEAIDSENTCLNSVALTMQYYSLLAEPLIA